MKALAALALAIALNSAAMNAQQTGVPTLGVGSTFVYRTTTNTAATTEVGAIETYDTMTVTRTNLTIGGRKGVIELFHNCGDGSDFYGFDYYSYLYFEANGDISESQIEAEPINDGDSDVDQWFTYPIGSRNATTTMVGEISDKSTSFETRHLYGGEEVDIVDGTPRTVQMVISTQTVWENRTGKGQDMGIRWYDPTIGYFTTTVERVAWVTKRCNLLSCTLKP